jgi:hypothetical protein
MKIAAALLAWLAAAAAPTADPVLGSGHGLDHVMVWTRDAEGTTRLMGEKLGFAVRPGGDFGNGIVNRLVRFPDRSYLELLSLTRPGDKLKGDAADAFEFLSRGPGAESFALESTDLDAAAASWRAQKLDLYPEEPIVYDPDGPGPRPAQEGLFRTLFLKERALRSGDLFLVSYRHPAAAGPNHSNTAQGLTAIWLVTPDLRADSVRLEALGLRRVAPLAIARLSAHGFVFAAGRGKVLLLEPDGPGGRAAEALRMRPGRIFALSIAVADVEAAKRIVERGYHARLRPFRGLWGKSFEAPTQADLGFTIEFHAAPSPA